jgi:hypothetical protein
MDIRISEILKEETLPVGQYTETQRNVTIPMLLSEDPTREWNEIFKDKLESEIDTPRCEVDINNRRIKLTCPVDHVQTFIDALRKVISTVNYEYEVREKERTRRDKARDEQAKSVRDDIQSRLSD